jgi:hypothetical protein
MAFKAEPSKGGTSSTARTVGGFVTNPAFDARTGARGAVDSKGNFILSSRAKLRRGYIMSADKGNDGKRYLLNFQYNPTSFSHSASLQADIPVLGADDGGSGQGGNWTAFVANSGQSVDFSLLFDRTYETWSYDSKKSASVQGVLADIRLLYAMLGMYYDSTTFTEGGGGKVAVPGANTTLSPTGVLTAKPVWVSFGQHMQYYGIIGSLNVTFTHFTQTMTPVRAAVSLSLSVLPRQAESPTTSATQTLNNIFTSASNSALMAQQRNNMDNRLTQNGVGVI